MQLSSTDPFSIRKLGVQAFFVLILLGFAFFSGLLSVLKTGSERVKVRVEATVLDVRPASPARDGMRRLSVKFEYVADNGRRYTRRRRVRTQRDVSVGQRITISYRKRRPRYGRVVSLRPPLPKIVPPQTPSGARQSDLQWLIGLIALPIIGYGVYLFLTGGRHNTRTPPIIESRPRRYRSEPHAHVTAPRREGRPERANPKPSFPPKHKSKVVRRASWF